MLSQALPAASPAAAPDMPDAFIDATGSVAGDHALVLGAGGLETMCALLRRGCASAIELRLGEKPDAGSADLVLVPALASIGQARAALAQARRALTPSGRIVLRGAFGVGDAQTLAIARLLRREGFCALRVQEIGGAAVLSAERPLFARPAMARA